VRKKISKDKLYRRRLKKRAKAILGNQCARCNVIGGPLEFHHLDGGGDRHRAEIGRSSDRIHQYVIKGNPEPKIVLLCPPCHTIIHKEAA